MDTPRLHPRALGIVVVAIVLPVALSAAWTPIRTEAPNVDLALVLVVAVAAVGAFGKRSAVVVAAAASPLAFEFFATAPYQHLGIAHSTDVEITVGLACAALVVGELALRVRAHRRAASEEQLGVSAVRRATELVASGQELVHVIEAVAAELAEVLSLTRCEFESSSPDGSRAQVGRDGELVFSGVHVAPEADSPIEVELPVVVEGQRIGQFVCGLSAGVAPVPTTMLVAVTLADTVATAFLAHSPPMPPPGHRLSVELRVLSAERAEVSAQSGPPRDASGLSSALAASR